MRYHLRTFIFLFGFLAFLGVGEKMVQAINSPVQNSGLGGGAINLSSQGNISIGTSTFLTNTRFSVVASTSDSSAYAFQVFPRTGNPLFTVRNDRIFSMAAPLSATNTLLVGGNVSVSGTLTATVLSGSGANNIAANDVIPGVFSDASNTGPFAFRASVAVNTSSLATSIVSDFNVYGSAYVQDSMRIGYPTFLTNARALHVISSGNPMASTTIGTDFQAIETPTVWTATTTIYGAISYSYTTATGGSAAQHRAYGMRGTGFGNNDNQPQSAHGVATQVYVASGDTGANYYAKNYCVDYVGCPSASGTQFGFYIDMSDPDPFTFGIYQKSNNPNYFTGPVGIGGSSTTYQLYMKAAANANLSFSIDTVTQGSSTEAITFNEAGTMRWLLGNSPPSSNLFFIINTATSTLPFVIDQSSNVGIATGTPMSGLHVGPGKYAQFEHQTAGVPPSVDCDSTTERGRWSLDTTNNRLYVCSGSGTPTWKYTTAI